MKKIFVIALSPILLTACGDRQQYQDAVLARLKKDQQLQQTQHIKDYNFDQERLARCVVDTTSTKMDGFLPFDPWKLQEYRNYTKMLTLEHSADPKKTLEELRAAFGSAKGLVEANANFTESTMECYSALVSETEAQAHEQPSAIPTPSTQPAANPAKPQ